MRIFYPGQKGAQVDYGNSHDDDNVDGLRFLPPGVRDPSDISDDNAPVVATDVLKRFGIPFRASGNLMSGSRGRAKGHDIRSMAAPEAIRLSLAEFMIDSKLVEVYADVDGVARFISIGNESWNPPDFFIAKSVTKLADQNVQLVVIRGYDRPPKRKVKTSKMIRLLEQQPGSNVGPVIVRSINPSDAGSQSFGSSSNPSHGSPTFLRHTSIVNKYASIVYQEPSWDDSYKNGLLNAYHPQCFESLIAWKTRINEEAKRAYDIDAKINLSNNSVISVLLTSSDIAGSYNYNPNATNTPWATLKLNPTNKEVGIFNNVSLCNLIYRQNLYGSMYILLKIFQIYF